MPPTEQFSILLVDDDSMVIRVLSRILCDFTPLRFATSGHAALKLARESLPDLVLLDVDMPGFSGFEVCKAFKSDPALAGVPVVFITSHESPQLQAKGFELGAADFISKPPHAPLVLARVRNYQRLKRLSDTLTSTQRNAVTLDFLTGTATRRQFENSLTQEWLRAQRSLEPLGLLLCCLDGFSAYGAEWGKATGDRCLKAVADALRSVVRRPTDVLGRYAEDMVAVLLPETNLRGVHIVAHRAVDAVAALQIPASAATAGDLTLSVGGGYIETADFRRTTADGARQPPHEAIAAELHAAAGRALAIARQADDSAVHIIGIASPVALRIATSRG